MKVLNHLLFLVAVIITGRADVKPERTRRDSNQIPVGGKVGAYGSSSVNPNTDAQLNTEIGEGGAYKDYRLQTPSSFGGLNEAGVSYRAEAKAVAGYEGESQFTGGNIVDDYGLAPPAEGFGIGNQLKTATQASASAEVQTGNTAENSETAEAEATAQTKLQAQFGQETQHGAEAPADAIIQKTQGDQYYEGTKVYYYQTKKPFYSIMPFREFIHLPVYDPSPIYNYNGVRPAHQYSRFPPTDPIIYTGVYDYWNPYTKPARAETFVQAEGGAQIGGSIEANALEEINSGSLNKYNGNVFNYTGDNGDNGGSLYGEALQANPKSHLQSGVQFGGPVGAEAAAQTISVVETRFGQINHPPRRPMQGFGYRHPYNWNRG